MVDTRTSGSDSRIVLTRRGVLAAAGALGLVGLAGHGRAAATGRAGGAGPSQEPDLTTTDDLVMTGARQARWLTVPMSRIVVNPYDFNQPTSEVTQNSGPQLPLSAGYYAHNQADRVPSLLMVYRRPAGEPNPQPPAVEFADDFDQLDPAWSAEPGVSASVSDSRLTMTLPESAPNPWGALTRELTVDVDAFPLVSIEVVGVAGAWALKVNDGSAAVDTVLQGDTTATGSFSYDLRQLAGWTGTKTFLLRLFVVERGAPLVVEGISVHGRPTSWLREATAHSTSWRPEALDFTVDYDDGGSLRGYDVFHDTTSISRVLEGSNGEGGLALTGRFTGHVDHDRSLGTLTVRADAFSYAVTVGAAARVTYYRSEVDMLAGGPTLPEPPAAGFWAVEAPAAGTTVGIGFAYRGEGTQAAAERALAAATADGARDARDRWQRYWNDVLARVPAPSDFALPAVPAQGVTADDVSATYYRAWHFMHANLLPEAPEVDYPYPQVAAGKPSMWNFGADGSRPSASWDSLLGIQYLAYSEPDLAWQAFLGLMSLVDNTGRLGGESLPSRKAQTAWILYNLSGDTQRLAACYPDLSRHLIWAQANPRWIFGDHDFPDERDAEFVVSLLLDLGYAARIAATLGIEADVQMWHDRAGQLTADYGDWFFPADGSAPTLQYHYLEGSHPDSPGNTLWVCTGLHLPQLTDTQQRLLRERFLDTYRPDATLAGWGFPDVKAPDVTYVAYGLLERGLVEQADVFIQANIRDIVRAGTFAEVYDDPPEGPVGTGVRPSLFGAVNLVDFVWLRNGYRADDGEPLFVRLPGADGGLSRLTLRRRRLDLDVDDAAGEILLTGTAVRGSDRCRRLIAPLGQPIPLPAGCSTG
jgi:hypothetical protein